MVVHIRKATEICLDELVHVSVWFSSPGLSVMDLPIARLRRIVSDERSSVIKP